MLQALLWPLAPTVLMLIAIAAPLGALFELSMFGLPGLLILASFISKYAYALLESAANGRAEPPPLSAEMVSPLEQRPTIQLGIALVVAALIGWLPQPAGTIVAVLAGLLVPASVGVLGLAGRAQDAANPVVLLRTIAGLGPWYPAILVFTALYAAVVTWAYTVPVWGLVRWAIQLFGLLSLFTFIGGGFHARRLQLGFDPIHSPEREASACGTTQRRAGNCRHGLLAWKNRSWRATRMRSCNERSHGTTNADRRSSPRASLRACYAAATAPRRSTSSPLHCHVPRS